MTHYKSGNRKIILETGMHRSGTSALSGFLHTAGFDIGQSIMPAKSDNALGFFENRLISNFNDRLLEHLHGTWDFPFFLDKNWLESKEMISFHRELEDLLEHEFKNSAAPILIKDPRLSLLFPFWEQHFSERKIEINLLIVLRHPIEIAASLKKRNGFSVQKSTLLWYQYISQIEQSTRSHNRHFVQYDSLIKHPVKTIEKLENWLKQHISTQFLSFPDALHYFNAKNRHHHFSSSSEIKLPQTFKNFHKLLLTLSNTTPNTETFHQLDLLRTAINPILDYALHEENVVPIIEQKRFLKSTLRIESNNTLFNGVSQEQVITLGQKHYYIKYVFKGSPPVKICHWMPVKGCWARIYLNEITITTARGNIMPIPSSSIQSNANETIEGEYVFRNTQPKFQFKVNQNIESIVLKFNLKIISGTEKDQLIDQLFGNLAHQIKSAEQKEEQIKQQVSILKEQLSETLLEHKQSDIFFESSQKETNQILQQQHTLIRELTTKIETKEQTLLTHLQDVAALKDQIAFLKNEGLRFKVDKQRTLNVLDKANARLEKFDELLADKEATLQKLTNQNQEMTAELKTLRPQFNTLNTKYKAASIQFQQLSSKLEEKDNNFEALATQYEILENRLNALIEQHQAAAKELIEKKSALAMMTNRQKNTQKKLTEKKDTIQLLLNQQAETDQQLQHLATQLAEKETQLTEKNRETVLQKKLIGELRSSIIFKVGSFFTAPLRWIYNGLERLKPTSSIGGIFLAAILMAMKHPWQFLKSLNPKNFRTLRHALNHESPELIQGNLINLYEDHTSPTLPPNLENDQAKTEVIQSILDSTQKVLSHKLKVIFVSPHLPDFDMSSGGKRATRMLELLSQHFEVFVFTFGDKPERHIAKLESFGAQVIPYESFEILKRQVPEMDAIIYAWFYSLYDGHELMQLYPNAKVIVDSVDVHWVREERSIGLIPELTPERVQQNKKLEIDVYQKAQIVWTVTEQDKAAILVEVPDADVRVVSNIHEPEIHTYQDSGNNNILFFGGFNHYPNISAVERIANHILPQVRTVIPDARLIIAGSKAPESIQVLGKRDDIDYLGFIEEEDVVKLYQNAFIAVVPLIAGAGIKGKICEAIAFMTPVLTNAIGNEGILLEHEKEGLIAESNEDFAKMLIKAFQREYDFAEMCRLAQIKMETLVGPSHVKQSMLNAVRPPVSICIVTWNRLELVKRCIESIEGNTFYPNYKILVHSNGCEDGTQDYLRQAAQINPHIIPILSDKNDVFVLPNNAMMRMFPDHDAILLNNDTYVTANWLNALHDAAYSSPHIGVSGSKILYPDGTLQEFGSELYATGSGRNIGKWENPDQEQYKSITEVGYVSGCSMYIKHSTLNKIGVFDEQFHPCYCEDSDYCYTAKEHGLATVVTPHSIIFHEEGKTSGTDTSSGFKAYQKINMKKFLAKHRGKDNGIDWTKN